MWVCQLTRLQQHYDHKGEGHMWKNLKIFVGIIFPKTFARLSWNPHYFFSTKKRIKGQGYMETNLKFLLGWNLHNILTACSWNLKGQGPGDYNDACEPDTTRIHLDHVTFKICFSSEEIHNWRRSSGECFIFIIQTSSNLSNHLHFLSFLTHVTFP